MSLRARQGRGVGGRETDSPDGGAEHDRLLQLDQGEVVGPGVAINHRHMKKSTRSDRPWNLKIWIHGINN